MTIICAYKSLTIPLALKNCVFHQVIWTNSMLPFWGFPWIPLRISPPKMGVWTSDKLPSDHTIHRKTPSFMEEVAWTEISVGRVHASFCLITNGPGKKKNKFCLGGTKLWRKPHHLDVLYHLDASKEFLTHHKCFVSMHENQPLAKLQLVVVSVVTKEWHRLESGHSVDWYVTWCNCSLPKHYPYHRFMVYTPTFGWFLWFSCR